MWLCGTESRAMLGPETSMPELFRRIRLKRGTMINKLHHELGRTQTRLLGCTSIILIWASVSSCIKSIKNVVYAARLKAICIHTSLCVLIT